MTDRARDLLVAVGCAAVALGTLAAVPVLDVEAAVPATGSGAWWGVAVLLLAQAASLSKAHAWPRAVLLGAAAAAPAVALSGGGDATSLTSVAIVVAAYVATVTTPVSTPVRDLLPTLIGAGVLVTAGGLISGWRTGAPALEAVGGSVVQAVGSLGAALLLGTWVASRREARRAREAEELAQARERDALVQAAIANERTAMARELHDIAAHHLSGIAVMAAAIGTQIDTDPAAAKEGVQQVRRQSTAVLRDLRALVGLLREDGAGAGVRLENLAGLPALVTDASQQGRPVSLTVLGEESLGHGVGPLAQLAAYRVVQEALTNASRHAPGVPVAVTVDARDAEQVLLTVRNSRGAATSDQDRGGFGLVGMRERAELTGASLEVGPTSDGGWEVQLRLPREEELS